MRFESEVEDYAARIKLDCTAEDYVTNVDLYRSCIPFDFWYVRDKDVEYNRDLWEGCVKKYIGNLKLAHRRGYGLFFEGDNGVGKSMFISHVLLQAIKAGYSAYYTTVLDLDFNLKRGMNCPEIMERMDEMLAADFLALDELVKERFKDGDSWMRTQVERILKGRNDNNHPTLTASNASLDDIGSEYGSSVKSVLAGNKYQHAVFDSGDFRELMRDKMQKDMGYE